MGGNGGLLIEILRAYPQPRGIVFDLPAVAERALANLAAAGLAERCTAVGGNALEMIHAGGDAYVFISVGLLWIVAISLTVLYGPVALARAAAATLPAEQT